MEKRLLWILTAILTCGLTITSCSNNDAPSLPQDEVEAQLSKMTLREKVGQMFFVRMETLDTTIPFTGMPIPTFRRILSMR